MTVINMREDILPHLEWEVLHKPITIPKVDNIEELPEGQKKIVINRDEHYKLRAVLSTKGDFKSFAEKTMDIVPGSFTELFKITGSDQQNLKQYTLESCCLGGSHAHIESGEEPLFETDIHIHGIRIRHKTEAEGMWLTEWNINGPRDALIFRNSTMRKMSRTFFRKRSAPKDGKIHSMKISGGLSKSFSSDFLRVKASDIQFLVTQVPKGIGPDWSSNIGIEYQKDWGRIPSVDERETISELCSFILGRQLLSVGYTIYDKDGNIVEEYACNPWGSDPRSLCSQPDFAPIGISYPSLQANAEDLISQLLSKYHELRSSLHLENALWLYWIARAMPVGTNLPILAAAVETIMNGWFDSTKSSSRGVYIDKDKFENLLHEEIGAIKSKLKSKQYGDNITNRIQNAYCMGVADRFLFFFKEIALDVSKKEQDAIDARHAIAHGRMPNKKSEWKRLIRQSQTYETLFHKIVLKLLGYSGTYIDRSTLGWKNKKLV